MSARVDGEETIMEEVENPEAASVDDTHML